jgi:hypothetical protein
MLKIINSHNQVLHVADMEMVYEYLAIVALDCVNRNATEYEPTTSVRVFKGEQEILDEYDADKLIQQECAEILRNTK